MSTHLDKALLQDDINPETGTKFSRRELEFAFDVIAADMAKRHDHTTGPFSWKLPINVLLEGGIGHNANAIDAMREAVIFFTGSVPIITVGSSHQVHIKAAGYYATIGA